MARYRLKLEPKFGYTLDQIRSQQSLPSRSKWNGFGRRIRDSVVDQIEHLTAHSMIITSTHQRNGESFYSILSANMPWVACFDKIGSNLRKSVSTLLINVHLDFTSFLSIVHIICSSVHWAYCNFRPLSLSLPNITHAYPSNWIPSNGDWFIGWTSKYYSKLHWRMLAYTCRCIRSLKYAIYPSSRWKSSSSISPWCEM